MPVIAKEQFDDAAEEFLSKYYQEALEEPKPVDVKAVYRNMGLTIQQGRLSQYFTIFGEMVFSDCNVDKWHEPLTEFDEGVWAQVIDCVAVQVDGTLAFRFKSGAEVEV